MENQLELLHQHHPATQATKTEGLVVLKSMPSCHHHGHGHAHDHVNDHAKKAEEGGSTVDTPSTKDTDSEEGPPAETCVPSTPLSKKPADSAPLKPEPQPLSAAVGVKPAKSEPGEGVRVDCCPVVSPLQSETSQKRPRAAYAADIETHGYSEGTKLET
jgi:hypothetical protein